MRSFFLYIYIVQCIRHVISLLCKHIGLDVSHRDLCSSSFLPRRLRYNPPPPPVDVYSLENWSDKTSNYRVDFSEIFVTDVEMLLKKVVSRANVRRLAYLWVRFIEGLICIVERWQSVC